MLPTPDIKMEIFGDKGSKSILIDCPKGCEEKYKALIAQGDKFEYTLLGGFVVVFVHIHDNFDITVRLSGDRSRASVERTLKVLIDLAFDKYLARIGV